MGLLAKRSRKARDSDNEFDYDDDMGSDEITMEQDGDSEDDEFESESDEENGFDDDEDETVGDDGGHDDDDDEETEDEDDEQDEDDEEEDEKNNLRNSLQDDAEMDELEKEYMSLRHQEQNILSTLKRDNDEDVRKGQAVRNQKALWDRTLEFRFLLQKAFSSSNRLPQDPIRSSFCDSDQSVNSAYSDLITSSKKTLDSLLELQEALLEKNPSILQATNGKAGQPSKHLQSSNSSDAKSDEDWSRISELHGRIAAFRNKSIDKWQRKSQVTTGAAAMKSKLHAFNQNISEQVASYMRDPSRMVKQMQLRRSTVAVFGNVSDGEAIPKGEGAKADGVAQADGDPELLDDSEFYQQLLKEFFETINPDSSGTALYALKRLQTKKRKLVDRRASKGRKIRYHVHEKILNFMTRQPPPNVNSSSPLGLFNNLFGSKTLKPNSAE